MRTRIRKFLDGIARGSVDAFMLFPDVDEGTRGVRGDGFQADAQRLRSDGQRVLGDLSRAYARQIRLMSSRHKLAKRPPASPLVMWRKALWLRTRRPQRDRFLHRECLGLESNVVRPFASLAHNATSTSACRRRQTDGDRGRSRVDGCRFCGILAA